MLKGNLIVGKNQSVVVQADSLRDLIKLAESKSPDSDSLASSNRYVSQPITLRIDLTDSEFVPETLFAGASNGIPERPVLAEDNT